MSEPARIAVVGVGAIGGAYAVVGRLGRRHGVPTPLNDAVTTLLRAADAGFEPASRRDPIRARRARPPGR